MSDEHEELIDIDPTTGWVIPHTLPDGTVIERDRFGLLSRREPTRRVQPMPFMPRRYGDAWEAAVSALHTAVCDGLPISAAKPQLLKRRAIIAKQKSIILQLRERLDRERRRA